MTSVIERFVAPEAQADPQPPAQCSTDTRGPHGRYTSEIAARILHEVEGGRSLHEVCSDDGVPGYSTVYSWVARDYHGFAARYALAREAGYAKRPHGTVYTEELAERILHELSRGRALFDVCMDDGLPAASTVKLWVSVDRDGFARRYQQAREGGGARGGQPTLYTAELAEYILDELADGRTLSDVCRDNGMPSRATVRLWVKQDREGFAARYKEARTFGYQSMGDAIIDIADDRRGDLIVRRRKDGTLEVTANPVNLNRSRFMGDSRRWLLLNALPRAEGGELALIARAAPGQSLDELLGFD